MTPAWAMPVLRCPRTGAALHLTPAAAGAWQALGAHGATPVGPTAEVLAAADGSVAYPVVDGIPLLLAPEVLVPAAAAPVEDEPPAALAPVDTTVAPYAESYAERRLYAHLAVTLAGNERWLARVRAAAGADASAFPEPATVWQDGGSTVAARTVALRHLAPLTGCRVLQLGGHGGHALTMLQAGASEAIVVSPVVEELARARELAAALGLSDRLAVVCGIGEELPLADGAVDRVFSGASIHHTVTGRSFAEAARVLAPGGRFASVDVWRNGRLYDAGIRVFGKRHGNRFCRPLDAARVAPAHEAFADVALSWHGALARYPLAVLERLGRSPGAARALRLGQWEDRTAARLRLGNRLASLVVVRGSVE